MLYPRLLLASGSPQRHQLLTDAGYALDIIIPDESAECGVCSTGGPAALVSELALRKATNVVGKLASSTVVNLDQPQIVVACDTLAECGGQVLGKPSDQQHAQSMLELLRGKRHRVYSGLCVWRLTPSKSAGQPDVRIAVTELEMDSLSDTEIEAYLATDLWRGKAGAFGFQDRPGWLRIVEGSESNVIGLPMELLSEMLTEANDENRMTKKNGPI